MAGFAERYRSTLTVLICFLVAVFEGIDLQAAGVAAPHLLPLFHLSPVQAGQFFSASTLGLLIGAPVSGWLADRVGRKLMLVVSLVLFGVFALATAFADDFTGLSALRLGTGVGLGGALPNMIALATENSRPERRGLAVGLMYCGMPLGGALASLVTVLGNSDWRTVFYLGGAAPLLVAPLVMLALRESRRPGAEAADAPRRPGVLRALFLGGRGVNTLLLWTAFGFTLLVLYLLLNWLPSLLVSRGLTRAVASEVQIAFNLGGVVGSVLVGWLIDGRHRLAVTVASFALTIGFLFALAAMPAAPVVAILVGGLVGVGIMSNQAVLYAIAPLCYPMNVRGAGVGAAVAVGRLGSLIGPLVAGQLVGAGHDAADVLFKMLPIVGVGAVGALILSLTRKPDFTAAG